MRAVSCAWGGVPGGAATLCHHLHRHCCWHSVLSHRVAPQPQPSRRLRHCAASPTAHAARDGDATSTKQLHRFYAPQLPPSVGSSIELEPDEARHAVRVLRLQPGDAVELCDGRGSIVRCEVAATSKSAAMLVTTAAPVSLPWRGPQWVVAAACLTLKGGRTDWLVEKATELGAHSLVPLLTERSTTGSSREKFRAAAAAAAGAGDSSSEHQASRLDRLALAATKQCLRAHALQLQPATSLEQLLPELQAAPISLVAAAGAPPILEVLRQQQQQHQQQQQQQQQQQPADAWCGRPCYLLIGPEGDFTPHEVARLAEAGVLPVGLGPNRLRTETAAIAALAAAVLASDAAA